MSDDIKKALELLCQTGANGIKFDVDAYMEIDADLMDEIDIEGPEPSSYDNGKMVLYSDDVHAWVAENQEDPDHYPELFPLMEKIAATVPLGFDITLSC